MITLSKIESQMIEDLLAADPAQLITVTVMALVPALIWFFLLFKGRRRTRLKLFFIFFLGMFTVVPFLIMEDFIWQWFPDLNIYNYIDRSIANASIASFIALLVVGATEEMAKSTVVKLVDKTRIGVQNINDAVRYSILAGLGFAFIENIFYFYYIWQSSGFVGLLFPMVFRSIFTVCAHMVFSGIFGYYHGLSKFSRPIMETKLWMGEKSRIVHVMSKILGTNESDAFRQLILFKGLIVVMLMHAFFNLFLELSFFVPVMVIVIGGFAYLMYLRAHKTGAIAYAGMGRQSTIARKDEDVVLELLALWTQEGRFKDVIDICQRLLMRDPDNKVVQLFQAKAMDKQKLDKLEQSFSSLFTSSETNEQDKSLRALVKQKVLMEMLREKQGSPASATPTPGPQTDPKAVLKPADVGLQPSPETQTEQKPEAPKPSPGIPRPGGM